MADCGCNHFPASGGNVTFDPGVQVGIGTTSPATLVHLFGGGSYPTLLFQGNDPASGVNGLAMQADAHGYTLLAGGSQNPTVPNAFALYDATASAFRLVVLPNGNVGIGTASPGAPLEVSTGSLAAPGFVVKFNGNGEIGDDTGLGHPGDGLVTVVTNGSERVRVDGSGNVGIGTQGPAYPLDVNGVARVSGVLLVGQDVTLNGAINKSIGGKLVDQGGCYYAN